MNRKEIKRKAHDILRHNIWALFKPQLILMIISYTIISLFDINNIPNSVITPFTFLLNIILYPLTIGIIYYILKYIRKEEYKITDIFKFYPYIILVGGLYILITIITMFWTMIFIIPGIIASFSFKMAPYLFADGITDPLECIAISKKMMKGYKMDYFIFMLSFIGWSFISLIAFWYVIPYISVSQAIYYEELKKITEID